MMFPRPIWALAALILICASCSPSIPQEAEDAYASLLTVQAGTQAGANYDHYNGLVIDAKARDKFNAMEEFDGEPDLPGIKAVIQYPE